METVGGGGGILVTSLVKLWEFPFLNESKMSDKQDIVTPRLVVICVCVHLAKSDLINLRCCH